MMRTHTTGPTVAEVNRLIEKLAAYEPFADFLRALGIKPRSDDARRRVAYSLAHLVLSLKKLPRPKPAGWSFEHDLTLHLEMLRLHHEEGLSGRSAIKVLAAAWDFPYRPQKGRRSAKSDPTKQREDALWSRWKSWKRRNKSFEEAKAKLGLWGGLILLMGDLNPAGENISEKRGFQFPSDAPHSGIVNRSRGNRWPT